MMIVVDNFFVISYFSICLLSSKVLRVKHVQGRLTNQLQLQFQVHLQLVKLLRLILYMTKLRRPPVTRSLTQSLHV